MIQFSYQNTHYYLIPTSDSENLLAFDALSRFLPFAWV
jgi:hypothetical protein